MTGPEHYQEAERLGKVAQGQDREWAMFTMAQAQVHATLALAAATALMRDEDGACYGAALSGWNRAAGE